MPCVQLEDLRERDHDHMFFLHHMLRAHNCTQNFRVSGRKGVAGRGRVHAMRSVVRFFSERHILDTLLL